MSTRENIRLIARVSLQTYGMIFYISSFYCNRPLSLSIFNIKYSYLGPFLAHLSRRRSSVHAFTISNMNCSKTSWPINIKSILSIIGRRLAALGFGVERIRTLVSMATDSSHRVIMGKIL